MSRYFLGIDPIVEHIIEVLDANPSFRRVLSDTFVGHQLQMGEEERRETEKEVDKLIAKEVIGVLPVDPVNKVYWKVWLSLPSRSSGEKFRIQTVDISIESALRITFSAFCNSIEPKLDSLRLKSAFDELERARALVESSSSPERNLFLINLVQGFCLSRIGEYEESTRALFRECGEYVDSLRSQLTAPQIELLEGEVREINSFIESISEDDIWDELHEIELESVMYPGYSRDNPADGPYITLSEKVQIAHEAREKRLLLVEELRVLDDRLVRVATLLRGNPKFKLTEPEAGI